MLRRNQVEPMTWFGASWGAPANDANSHQLTPVGEVCSWCEELIELWASGVVMSHLEAFGTMRRPLHLECFMRSCGGIESVGHQLGVCYCAGSRRMWNDPPWLTTRESALAAVLLIVSKLPWHWDELTHEVARGTFP